MVAGTIPFAAPDPVAGVRVGTGIAGIKQPDRKDTVLFELSPGAMCAAVFTRNAFCAAPVVIARNHLRSHAPRYLLINSGNANAGTGDSGFRDALRTCEFVAEATGCLVEEVMPFSTGVIGQRLPVEKFRNAIPSALASLSSHGWGDAAHAIMTTDTMPKAVSRALSLDGKRITVSGIAKGAGMIRPDMATMLGFLGTDAAIARPVLQVMLNAAVNRSFNRITIDGDTSTNDACVMMATGRAGNAPITDIESVSGRRVQVAIEEVCGFLAEAIVRDGEGATKFIRIKVLGGRTREECQAVGYTIAHSPLVKTAFFASDANWGRILAAIGRAGLSDLEINRVVVDINGVRIVEHGGRADSYTEEAGSAAMQPTDITISVDLGRGDAQDVIMTCDLSFDYVRINAEYRT